MIEHSKSNDMSHLWHKYIQWVPKINKQKVRNLMSKSEIFNQRPRRVGVHSLLTFEHPSMTEFCRIWLKISRWWIRTPMLILMMPILLRCGSSEDDVPMCLYSSVVERQSCKLEVRSSILRGGIILFVFDHRNDKKNCSFYTYQREENSVLLRMSDSTCSRNCFTDGFINSENHFVELLTIVNHIKTYWTTFSIR